MLQSISKLANDAVGVEKTLKLLQNTSQIAANIGHWSPSKAAQLTTAKSQFALARRYFRLLKWIDYWTNAYNQYQSYLPTPSQASTNDEKSRTRKPPPAQDSLHFLLLVSKWSLLGGYVFLEMFTIVDAVLGTWRPWAAFTQTEALKIWFYALAVSVVLDLYEIFFVSSDSASLTATSRKQKMTEKNTRAKTSAESGSEGQKQLTVSTGSTANFSQVTRRRQLYKQLVIDSCDLLVPGVAVGWLGLDPVTVGIAGSISALTGGSDAWARVNA